MKSLVSWLFSLLYKGSDGRSPLALGAAAPKMSCRNQDGELVDLGELFSQGLTLVYFYPKADTPGCTKQSCNLRDAYASVRDAGIEVIGVSADKPAQQKAFARKHNLPFTLISDADTRLMEAFGVAALAGRFAARQSFLLKNGKVVWLDLSSTPASQSQDVLAAAKSLR